MRATRQYRGTVPDGVAGRDGVPGPDPDPEADPAEEAGIPGVDRTDAGEAGRPDARESDPSGAPADDPEAEAGRDPRRFNEWRKRSATGVVISGIALGLREALELPDQRPALVVEAPGDPSAPDRPVALHFDPDDPAATVALVRHPAGPPGPATAASYREEKNVRHQDEGGEGDDDGGGGADVGGDGRVDPGETARRRRP